MTSAVALIALAVAGIAALLAARSRAGEKALRAELASLEERSLDDGAGAPVAARLADALAVITQGVVIADAEGTVAYANTVGRQFLQARHGDALVEAAVRELLLEALGGAGAERHLDLFGPPRRLLHVRAAPLGRQAMGAGAVCVVTDETDRRRIDEVRRDFVANISHELKTPVSGMSLLAETLVGETDPEKCARLTERLLSEANRVSRMIDDLLELTKIEATGAADHSPVDAASVIAEAVARASSRAESRGVTIQVRGPAQPVTVRGDQRQLVSAVYNLVENAVKYSPDGAEVRVAVTNESEGRAQFVVADDGSGIPQRDLDRIFERFYRVDPSRGRATGGIGLGLAIVRHVAHNHGGEVDVSSREGEGSTFGITVPTLVDQAAV